MRVCLGQALDQTGQFCNSHDKRRFPYGQRVNGHKAIRLPAGLLFFLPTLRSPRGSYLLFSINPIGLFATDPLLTLSHAVRSTSKNLLPPGLVSKVQFMINTKVMPRHTTSLYYKSWMLEGVVTIPRLRAATRNLLLAHPPVILLRHHA
jgi:hypothetical protein